MWAVFFELLLDQWLMNMVLPSDPAPVMWHILLLGCPYMSLRTLQLFHRPMKKRAILNSVLSDPAPVMWHVLLLGYPYMCLRTLQLFHRAMKKRAILNSVLLVQFKLKVTLPTP